MIHNIHGAPHHSTVTTGDTKRLVSALWEQPEGAEKTFKGWYHATSVNVVSGTATVVDTVDTNGAPAKDIQFTTQGTVELDVTVGSTTRRLVIEVVG